MHAIFIPQKVIEFKQFHHAKPTIRRQYQLVYLLQQAPKPPNYLPIIVIVLKMWVRKPMRLRHVSGLKVLRQMLRQTNPGGILHREK